MDNTPLTRAERRERKKRLTMKVSGKSVFTLRSIIIRKAKTAKRKRPR